MCASATARSLPQATASKPPGGHHPVRAVSEGQTEPECCGAGLVQSACYRKCACYRAVHTVAKRVLAGDPDASRREILARRAHHPRRMETLLGAAAALRLSARGTEPAGGRGTVEHEGACGGFTVQVREGSEQGPDLPVGPASEAAEAAGRRPGHRAGAGRGAGADRRELGGGEVRAVRIIEAGRRPFAVPRSARAHRGPGGRA